MKKEVTYDAESVKKRYDLLTDDMLYDIIMNLRDNELSFDDLASDLGVTTENLMNNLVDRKKDFFVCLESISYFQGKEIYKNHSRVFEKNKGR